VAAQLNGGVKGLMKKNKVTVVDGEGRLAGKGTLQVGDKTLSAKHIIVATGARARDLPFAKADGERIWTYRHAMVPKVMPTKLLVIGSGAIGVEFASFYSDMGAEVTIVEMLDRILPVEDPDISAFVHKALTKQGMKIHTSSGVEKLEPHGSGVRATLKGGAVEEFSHAIVAIGIVPNTENIGLEALGVKTERGHIVTDGYGRTNVEGVYAIGDVTGLHLFAAAGRVGRLYRSQGEGARSRGQGRQIPIHRQRQGDRARRSGRLREDGVRRQDRRIARCAHGGGRGDGADPGLCDRPAA
jgi:dihydrolipoamide dehydrogenase